MDNCNFVYKYSKNGEICLNIPKNIYYPDEDSMLIADYIKSINMKGKDVLEIGCGSGFLSILAFKMGGAVISVDIDENAIATTLKNSELNEAHIKATKSDVFENVNGKFDIIIFNSPYLPKSRHDKNFKESIQWSSPRAISSFLKNFKEYLKDGGYALLLISSITGIHIGDFEYEIVSRKKLEWEELLLIKLFK